MRKLRLAVLNTGKTQYQVAAEAGIPPSKLSEYCMGRREITPRHMIALCEVFRCQPEDILGEDENSFV